MIFTRPFASERVIVRVRVIEASEISISVGRDITEVAARNLFRN